MSFFNTFLKIVFVLFFLIHHQLLYGQKYAIDWDFISPEGQSHKLINVASEQDSINTGCKYILDNNGRITNISCGESWRNDYSNNVYNYDSNGRVTYNFRVYGSAGSDYGSSYTDKYTYDEKGNYLSAEYSSYYQYNWSSSESKTFYKNLYEGNILYSVVATTVSLDYSGKAVSDTIISYFFYDSLYLTNKIDYHFKDSSFALDIYTYNIDHYLESISKFKSKTKFSAPWNRNKVLTELILMIGNKSPDKLISYQYNNNQLTKISEKDNLNLKEETRAYEYDQFGNVIRIDYTVPNGDNYSKIRSYQYTK